MKKKLYIVIFALLFFIMNSCKSAEKEVVFLRNNILNTIKEMVFIDNIKNSNFKFKEVVLSDQEEFDDYVNNNLNSRKKSNKVFISSENFSNNGIISPDLININGQGDDQVNLNIDHRHLVYIFGIVSGMVTRTNNVSVVYSSNFKDYSEYLLSFISGVKKVNLRAYDSLLNGKNIFDTSNSNIEDKKEVINNFIKNNKSDVIFYLDENILDNLKDILEEGSKIVLSLNEFVDNNYLKVSYLYDDIINNGSENFKNYSLSLIDDSIKIDIDSLADEVRLIVEENLNKIKNGSIYIPSNLNELKGMLK